MAARTKSKAKDAAAGAEDAPAERPARKTARGSGKPAAKKAASSSRKTAPASQEGRAGSGKAATKKTATTKAKGRKTARGGRDENQLLVEQNEALRAELDAARARIAHLEKVHGEVVDRIDWVIDSLQTALEDTA